ncbi:MAG TPA: amidohydrolase [Stellaceae bacterium]|nr:amidohydrolase [Stellaceae bacterium]
MNAARGGLAALGTAIWLLGSMSGACATDIDGLNGEAIEKVGAMSKLTQQMVDEIYSYSELGYHEVETSRYVTGILAENGFAVERGVAGMPTAWVATFGSGKPMIGLGADEDCLPGLSQKPGVAYRAPIVEGAPGHGEGHNTGLPLVVTAALALKDIMAREHLPGTLMIWPGIAEEELGGKAHLVRAGVFRDVDAVIFAHIGGNMEVAWGALNMTGLTSIEFTFHGRTAHAAFAPWEGHSALKAVELMDAGWNYRREHLRPQQRSHYVISNGGDQPNVVPATASVWYYLRELDYPHIQELRDIALRVAEGAAMMTDTTMTHRTLGSAWPGHFNKPMAEAMGKNMERVGMPAWDDKDVALAKAVQKLTDKPQIGMANTVKGTEEPPSTRQGGASDDVGDVSWVVPTVVLRYPANVTGVAYHHWTAGIAAATPIAHKGTTAGAKVMAATTLDLLMRPELVAEARDYFERVQTKDQKYLPLLEPDDQPALFLNDEIVAKMRPQLERYYYDPSRYATYMEQLGIVYPTIGEQKSDAQ